MKTSPGFGFLALAVLLIASCGKEEAKPAAAAAPETKKTAAAPKPPAPRPPPPDAPQGKLPVMAPEKAKFIAVPNTPKDKEAEAKPVETKAQLPATTLAPEIKKPATQAQEAPAVIIQKPEVKKAEVK